MQVDQLLQVAEDAVQLDGTHAGKALHGLAEALLHDLQAFQMSVLRVDELVDGGLKLPFPRLIQNLEDVVGNEFAQVR